MRLTILFILTLAVAAGSVDAGISDACHHVTISKRPRAMLKAAIEYHFDRRDAEQGTTSVYQRELFRGLLQEQPVTGPDLEAAVAADQAGPA